MSFVLRINSAETDALMAQSPRIFNTEFNRGFSRTATAFYRFFTKARLSGKDGIRVRRKVAAKSAGRGGIAVPAKARAMGFSGVLRNRDRLDGKVAILRNTNPVAISHEEGVSITSQKGPYLFVRIRNAAAARRAGVKIKRGAKPTVIRVKKVQMKKRLRFISTWNGWVNTASLRLARTLRRAGERSQFAARRKAAKRKAV